ncbi:MAG: hypothetical protein CVV42_05420 [Candidatus Riflebacteria bacterium HGW-Riflebacteria-2]|jgi:predicted nuclease with TOPRIM domain|nr:MAG: hypothetical protein CVV42_05420 [Candidatus Riflebacteria bacterium HGW-Riflebacteria-2]
MRSYAIPFLLAGLIIASAGDVEAQRTGNREMHERINALRNRLQNYQLERVREEPKLAPVVQEKETVEVKFEELVENFESRKDVAVTVLFHDEDFAKSQATEIAPVNATDKKTETAAPVEEPVKVAATFMPKTPDIIDAAKQLELERAQRQEKYEALRRRVHMATRRVHDQALEINSMVAQIP